MRFFCSLIFFAASFCSQVFSQTKQPVFEASFAASLRASDGGLNATLFLRPALPIFSNLFVESTLAFDYEKRTVAIFYTSGVRKDWPRTKWTPFLLAGGGAETQLTGPFAETKPLFYLGGGGLFSLSKTAFLRAEYQLQRLNGNLDSFTRHFLMFGIQIRWTK